jgi:OHCU decarboxylase
MNLDHLNALDDERAAAALLQCCGSTRWARAMAAARPFTDAEALAESADRIWSSLVPSDWREAFAAHPRIGAGGAGGAAGSNASRGPALSEQGVARAEGWSAQEQADVRSAAADVQQRLADANREYEARFGYIFIVCATGKSASEMLAMLESRLQHAPEEELVIAAEEQRKITRLRLTKLLALHV